MMYRQAAGGEYPRRKTHSTAMEVAFENCFRGVLPQLRVSELVRLGVALAAYVRLLTASLVYFPAYGTVSF